MAWPEDGERAAVLRSAAGAELPLFAQVLPKMPTGPGRQQGGAQHHPAAPGQVTSPWSPALSTLDSQKGMTQGVGQFHGPFSPQKDVFCSLLSCRLATLATKCLGPPLQKGLGALSHGTVGMNRADSLRFPVQVTSP